MYSMVLMMAMSASPEAATFHRGGGCNGGCQGVVAYSSCQGGGHGHKARGGLFGGRGCHGSSYASCSGYSAGCTGSYAAPVYTSCNGCQGGGLFSRGHGCNGGGLFSRKHHGCSGSYASGCIGSYSTGCTGGGVYGAPPVVNPNKDMPKVEPKKGGVTSAPAFITVNVPADAKILIDGAATKSVSTVRTFSTPELNAGTVYYYTLTAEVVREGKTYTATEKVAVEAGVTAQITLNPNVGATVASK